MKIEVDVKIGNIIVEEFGYFDGGQDYWWCRCFCGRPAILWSERQLQKLIVSKSTTACSGCRRLTNQKRGWIKRKCKQKPRKSTFIYLLGSQETNRYKIGHSNAPEKRLATIQSANSTKITMLQCVWATLDAETALHQQFQEHRVRGEWFEFSSEKLKQVEKAFTGLIVSV